MRVQVLQRMRSDKRGKGLAVLAIALSVAGCSKQEETRVPVDCMVGASALRDALERAPARVELGVRNVPLSECIVRGSDSSDLQALGTVWVSVAAYNADLARLNPKGAEALRLGYLVGAARRGAGRTQGVHEELLRRIEQETIGVNTRSRAYQRGVRAGREHG